jgi:hypothetical protein
MVHPFGHIDVTVFLWALSRQQFFTFLPLPQGHHSFLPIAFDMIDS